MGPRVLASFLICPGGAHPGILSAITIGAAQLYANRDELGSRRKWEFQNEELEFEGYIETTWKRGFIECLSGIIFEGEVSYGHRTAFYRVLFRDIDLENLRQELSMLHEAGQTFLRSRSVPSLN